MLNKLFRGPRAGLLLLPLVIPGLIFVAVLLAGIGQAPAQTYVYIGPNWDVAYCTAHGYGAACIPGSVTGTVTLNGIAPGYTGAVPQSKVSSYQLNATGIQSLSDLADLGWSNVAMTNGQFTNWQFEAVHSYSATHLVVKIKRKDPSRMAEFRAHAAILWVSSV
jgi:hypothetical protein